MAANATVLLIVLCLLACGCAADRESPSGAGGASGVDFDRAADAALQAMKQHAIGISANGAAMVAYVPGDATASWTSRMLVVGSFISKNDDNLLAIVYTKASEMADTLKDSGSGIRPKKKGENGWKGGVARKVPGGYVLAAFSGAKTEDDVAMAQLGVEILEKAYR